MTTTVDLKCDFVVPYAGGHNVTENGTLPSQKSAVYIKNLCKRYTDKGPATLQNFEMNVRKGTIYGLLGSSGCGKTTILSCIVGLKKWDSGDLLVFGKKPGTKGSGIPGNRLGYMPQDLALYNQLTIREVCRFYGHIYNMSGEEIRERYKFLELLLELPTVFRQIGNLSGGQKRRASLALALIHSPDLLVLDEPTVGLDPLLREKIWMHLHGLVDTLGTTVIITTHYIEEARLSAKIGVMRKGRMLVEDTPHNLLRDYKCELLEQVVLQLCRKDTNNLQSVKCNDNVNHTPAKTGWIDNKVVSSSVTVNNEEYEKMAGKFQQMKKFDYDNKRLSSAPRKNSYANPRVGDIFSKIQETGPVRMLNRIYGYSVVQFLILFRHLGLLTVILFMPTIQGTLTLLVLGSEPRGMTLGIVNGELTNWTTECDMPHHLGNSCDLSYLSCKYINLLEKDDRLRLTAAKDEEEALSQVYGGDTWGYLVFPNNYSQHGVDRAVAGRFALNTTLDGFQIKGHLDYSQFIGTAYITTHLLGSFKGYLEQVVRSCDLGSSVAQLPLEFRPPVYGDEDSTSLTAFVMPGVIIVSFLGMTMGLTAVIFISDRKEGTLSRAISAGLKSWDVMAAYLITQGAVSIAQIVVWQLVLWIVFSFEIHGPVWLWLVFLVLAGLCGAALGIFLGIICKEEVEALIVGVFLVPILLLFGGVVFPTESMTPFWLSVGRLVPTHLPTQALRSVVVRGMGITDPIVWPGLVSLVAWMVLLLTLAKLSFSKVCK